MATLLLSAAGLALGNAVGGSVLGLSSSVIGRAAGAMLGRAIDARLLGSGSPPVETGRTDRFRLTGAGEGAPVARVYGRIRVPGHVIWAGPFVESVSVGGGGKGAPRRPRSRAYSYSVSLAIALCEGEVAGVGRIWADGTEIPLSDLALHLHPGADDQLPDPRIAAVEGIDRTPAFRGLAYVVIEDLDLGRFGNRVPQFSFEVHRPARPRPGRRPEDMPGLVRGVALIPGTGEFSLATTPLFRSEGFGERVPVNVNTAQARADFTVALDQLEAELPRARSVVLVVSWFGDDLRCNLCTIRPKVEPGSRDPEGASRRVSGLTRATAAAVPLLEGGAVYGGTPSDASVIEAIGEMRARGLKVTFYPFILMEQLAGNGRPDPWSDAPDQPPLPWRGRITTSRAPGRPGSPDGTAAADAEVAAFFGQAAPGDFHAGAAGIDYTGPEDWGFRRFILHYAHLCARAGGVDAFCIGSELRGLTQIRGAEGFPAVVALMQLAAEVRAILGPAVRIGYAADWSEYHGYQPEGTADKYFHLDPLWAHPAIDFIGIDNYMPLSDWREGTAHADAWAGAIYNLDYLAGNVAGGEYYDWFYHSAEAREAQIRTPITDGEGEPWVWRAKDIRGWWSNRHFDRVGGVRATEPSPWIPASKPVWFTEYGCPAVDKGTNEPNKFLDPKSSESALPHFSTGLRDDLIQLQYLRAIDRHFADPANNPVSPVYGGRMVDMDRAHVWAWDARPFPAFPARSGVWADAPNWRRGHWITGRSTGLSLATVVEEICADAGIAEVDTSRLHGHVRGYRIEEGGTARAALQPLMLAHAFDAAERDGRLVFASRRGDAPRTVDPAGLAIDPEAEAVLVRSRAPEAEVTGRARVGFIAAEGDYAARVAEAVLPDEGSRTATGADLALTLTPAEGRQIAERWLIESRLARETLRFALPPSAIDLGPGDVVALDGASWRIDRAETGSLTRVEAVRIEAETYRPHETTDDAVPDTAGPPAVPVELVFLDLPLLRGDEVPHAPHVAATARPWPGPVALYDAAEDSDFRLLATLPVPSVIGTTLTALPSARPGLWDRGPALRVRLVRGALAAATPAAVLAGANLAAIGDGVTDLWEVFQFAEAALVAPSTWDLRLRLRGQAGTDGVMPAEWPAGSRFVLLDGVPEQPDLAPGSRGVARDYRWGPASRPLGDASFRHRRVAFAGIGLRPYSVAHLRARPGPDGLRISWIRRGRIAADDWEADEIPLGEGREAYLLRISAGGILRREAILSSPGWTYSPAQQLADGVSGEISVAVAQLSDSFGPGPFAVCRVTV